MFTVFLKKQNNFDKNKQNTILVNCISIPHVITLRVVVISVSLDMTTYSIPRSSIAIL